MSLMMDRFFVKPPVYITYPLCSLIALKFQHFWGSLCLKQIIINRAFKGVKEYQAKKSNLDLCVTGPIVEELIYSSGYTTSTANELIRSLNTMWACFFSCTNYINMLGALTSIMFNKSLLSKFMSGLLFGMVHVPKNSTFDRGILITLLFAPFHWLRLSLSSVISNNYGPWYGYFYTFFEHMSINTYAVLCG